MIFTFHTLEEITIDHDPWVYCELWHQRTIAQFTHPLNASHHFLRHFTKKKSSPLCTPLWCVISDSFSPSAFSLYLFSMQCVCLHYNECEARKIGKKLVKCHERRKNIVLCIYNSGKWIVNRAHGPLIEEYHIGEYATPARKRNVEFKRKVKKNSMRTVHFFPSVFFH